MTRGEPPNDRNGTLGLELAFFVGGRLDGDIGSR